MSGTLGDHHAAASLYDALLALGAPDEATLRDAFATFTEAGRYAAAMTTGADIILLAPDDVQFCAVYSTLLDKKLYSDMFEDAQETAAIARPRAMPVAIQAPTHVSRWSVETSVLYALFVRELKTKFGRSRLGYLWAIFEPLAHIGVMITLIGFLKNTTGHDSGAFYTLAAMAFVASLICVSMRWSPAIRQSRRT